MGLTLMVVDARAAFTEINGPPSDEVGHADIFAQSLGGSFEPDGVDLENGQVTARRVDDAADRFVDPGRYEVQVVSAFADRSHSMGYQPGTSGGSYQNLFDVAGSGFNVSGSTTVALGSAFRWARGGPGAVITTNPADNGGKDRAVTYEIDGGSSSGDRFVFFEDWVDNDYQDLIVRVRALPSSNPAPDPPDNPTPDNPDNPDNGNPGNGNAGNDSGPDNVPDNPGGSVNMAPTPTAAGAGAVLLLGSVLMRRRGRDRR